MAIFDIATLGTSLTAGTGTRWSWLRDLDAALMVGKKSRIRTYNFAIAGGYSSDALPIVSRVAAIRPKVILCEFLMNDCLLSYDTSRANTISILDSLKTVSPNSKIYLMTMNPTRGSSSAALARAALPTFNPMYTELSASQDVGLIDSYLGWAAATLDDIPDGVHATDAANRTYLVPKVADVLAPFIS